MSDDQPQPYVAPDATVNPVGAPKLHEPPAEYAAFENLTSKLVKVSKAEVDEQRKKA